ncbi:MAG: DNA polymerase III subunit alpha [Candidatus Shikimatogenerans sp. JK-2022]|nr:DNA polymerase III subunit alpha [Candidatus Shikimatogenerans bostrichidophilus]
MNFAGSIPALGNILIFNYLIIIYFIYILIYNLNKKLMFLFFDTETTGLPKNKIFNISEILSWPRLIQISWILYDLNGNILNSKNYYIKPNKYIIPLNSMLIHGITNKYVNKYGKDIIYILKKFYKSLKYSKFIIGHNINFDCNIIIGEFYRLNYNIKKLIEKKKKIDTQIILYNNKDILKIKKNRWISLKEAYKILYNKNINKNLLHNSFYDLYINILCFIKLIKIKIIKFNFNIKIKNFLKKKNKYKKYFFNINNHTNYCILNSTIKIDDLINKTSEYNMKAVGITDNNLMGSYYFLEKINNYNINNKNKIKPIIGFELFVKIDNENLIIILIAKNKIGFLNLIKISSLSYFNNNNIYNISKKIIKKYKKGLIFLISPYKSIISYYIINNKFNHAIKELLYWKKIFNNNLFIEIFKNNFKYEKKINKYLIQYSKKYNIDYINQNYIFYINKSDYKIYNILLCIKNKEKQNIKINNKKKKDNYYLFKENLYFKKYSEIKKKFKTLKKGFFNLKKLYKKIKFFNIKKKNLLPNYKLTNSLKNKFKKKKNINFNYLKYITYKGAKKKYKIINNNIKKRIKKELKIIKDKNFEDYFLIVYDIVKQAKKMNVYIGAGRGSVAGSIISYCINITKVDPLKYNLIFERFLNADRVNMPDIDIDFDKKGRKKIIKYLQNKYGYLNISNIITFGKLGSKLAIKDTSRVFNLSLKKSNILSNYLVKKYSLKILLNNDISYFKKKIKEKGIKKIINLKKIYVNKNSLESKVLKNAQLIEGMIRNTSMHACGIIISKKKLYNNIPIIYNDKKKILLTQYDTYCNEKIGLLKIDLLYLNFLTIIKDTLNLIKNKKKKKFSLNDKKTLNLFRNGYTIGVFQYDSLGIRDYVKHLKPKNFNDLIIMNALYRPGTIKYIEDFILRKNGQKKISYDLPIMKKYLKETCGITIFQEQVILIARKLSGISKIEADNLREAIAKKKIYKLKNLKSKFFKNSIKNGYSLNILKKIWKDWENFSLYAFNKSHATCYSYITFQTAFLKTHYKLEYMCSLLSNNIHKYKNLKLFLEETKRLKIKILKPDINISNNKFIIENKKLRFGFGAIKNIGKISIQHIIKKRKNKKFKSFIDFIKRINLRIINKQTIKILILSGCLDSLNIKKYNFFLKKNSKFISSSVIII